MGVNYLWDTNTVIYFLQQQFPLDAEKFIDEIVQKNIPFISAITEIELLCWKSAFEKDMIVLNNFITDSNVIELEQSIKLKTAELRKLHKIKLPDAIIGATALVYDLTIITRNTSDFKNIEGIKLVNPFEM